MEADKSDPFAEFAQYCDEDENFSITLGNESTIGAIFSFQY